MRGGIGAFARTYQKMSASVTAVLAVVVALPVVLLVLPEPLFPVALVSLSVSVAFSLVACIAYGGAWMAVTKHAPENLGKFYLVASVLRMMGALLVVLAAALALRPDGQATLCFISFFAAFYIVLQIADCIYFVRMFKKEGAAIAHPIK